MRKLLLSPSSIHAGVGELAQKVSRVCDNWLVEDPDVQIVIVGILKGCVWLYSDLTQRLPSDLKFSSYFIESTSYQGLEQRERRLSSPICKEKFSGKKVVLLDELYDNGSTFDFVKKLISQEANIPEKDIVTVCLVKKNKTSTHPPPDLFAFILPDVWLVGYGLDDDQRFRHRVEVVAVQKPSTDDETQDDQLFYDDRVYQRVLEGIQREEFKWLENRSREMMLSGKY